MEMSFEASEQIDSTRQQVQILRHVFEPSGFREANQLMIVQSPPFVVECDELERSGYCEFNRSPPN
eukprot:889209-Pyramimonas_sp.AAC.1